MTVNSYAYETQLLRAHTPRLRYDGTVPFGQWQTMAREKLAELLGLPLGECETNLTVEWTKEEADFTEYRFLTETEPGYCVPCHLRLPRGEGRVPLTVCLSGHGGGMHVALGVAKTAEDAQMLSEWHHRAMAVRAIRDGRAALVIEARNFGESSVEGYGTSCTEAAKNAILMGRTVIGERVWDAMRILDAVSARFSDRLDLSDVVCTGNSGGGTATYYLACMDERITAALPSCSVCSYEASIAARPHCMCNHIPSVRKYFEMGDLGGLIAPRVLIVAAGAKDGGFPLSGTRDAFSLIERMYEAAGAAQNCALTVADGDHLNYADHLWAALAQMRRQSVKKETKE